MKPKKLFAILLSLALVVGMIPAFGVTVSAASITNLVVNENGLVTWDKVSGAEKYEITDYKKASFKQSGNSFDYKTHLMNYGVPSGTYSFSIAAYDSSNARITTPVSGSYIYTSKGKLNKPASVTWDGRTAK